MRRRRAVLFQRLRTAMRPLLGIIRLPGARPRGIARRHVTVLVHVDPVFPRSQPSDVRRDDDELLTASILFQRKVHRPAYVTTHPRGRQLGRALDRRERRRRHRSARTERENGVRERARGATPTDVIIIIIEERIRTRASRDADDALATPPRASPDDASPRPHLRARARRHTPRADVCR